jgi:hypothetical protein
MVSEVQFYAMVDQVAAALDAIEFNDVGCTMKNCKVLCGENRFGLDRILCLFACVCNAGAMINVTVIL